MQSAPLLSIIIPALNEAEAIAATLTPLQMLRRERCEVIVCDGGSDDDTPAIASPLADAVIECPRGRARQMNAGAARAAGKTLLFLHADTLLPPNAPRQIEDGLAQRHARWGRFDVRLSGPHPLLRVVEYMMNLRSRLTGIATGDQGIFVRRRDFFAVGGYPEIPLMEDIALSNRLSRFGRPLCLKEKVATSSRRWDNQGIVTTILLMWWVRLLYFFGIDTARLADLYSRGILWKRSSA
ncbi:MAG: TIGR04283 family arsenosugar biosynthesis glycosyltransferase [Pseudomonadota bacterium]